MYIMGLQSNFKNKINTEIHFVSDCTRLPFFRILILAGKKSCVQGKQKLLIVTHLTLVVCEKL